jgi:hypothetical protein
MTGTHGNGSISGISSREGRTSNEILQAKETRGTDDSRRHRVEDQGVEVYHAFG